MSRLLGRKEMVDGWSVKSGMTTSKFRALWVYQPGTTCSDVNVIHVFTPRRSGSSSLPNTQAPMVKLDSWQSVSRKGIKMRLITKLKEMTGNHPMTQKLKHWMLNLSNDTIWTCLPSLSWWLNLAFAFAHAFHVPVFYVVWFPKSSDELWDWTVLVVSFLLRFHHNGVCCCLKVK